MKRHKGMQTSQGGRVDAEGFGSAYSVWAWPTLGVHGHIRSGGTGEVRRPALFGAGYNPEGTPSDGPLTMWTTDRDLRTAARTYWEECDGPRAFVCAADMCILEFDSPEQARQYLA